MLSEVARLRLRVAELELILSEKEASLKAAEDAATEARLR